MFVSLRVQISNFLFYIVIMMMYTLTAPRSTVDPCGLQPSVHIYSPVVCDAAASEGLLRSLFASAFASSQQGWAQRRSKTSRTTPSEHHGPGHAPFGSSRKCRRTRGGGIRDSRRDVFVCCCRRYPCRLFVGGRGLLLGGWLAGSLGCDLLARRATPVTPSRTTAAADRRGPSLRHRARQAGGPG